MSSVKKINTFNIIFSLIFLTVILFFFYAISGSVIKQYYSNKHYVNTKVKILESNIKESNDENSTSFSPYIKYSYYVTGEVYKSDNYAYFGGYNASNLSEVEKIVNSYQINSNAIGYYDPNKPENSVLNNYKPSIGIIFLIFFIMSLLTLIPIIFILKEFFDLKLLFQKYLIRKYY